MIVDIDIRPDFYAYINCDDSHLMKLLEKSFTRNVRVYNNYLRRYNDKKEKYYSVVKTNNNNNSSLIIKVKAGLIPFLINSFKERDIQYNLIDNRQKLENYNIITQLNSDIKLRDYQEEAVNAIFKGCYCCVQLPTSSGKTEVAASIIKTYQQNKLDRAVLYIVPTISLQKEAKDRFIKYGISCNTELPIKSGVCNIITYASIVRSKQIDYKQRDSVGLMILDEVHHMKGPKNSKIVHNYKKTNMVVGLSATIALDIQYKKRLNQLSSNDFAIFGCTGFPVYYKLIEKTIEEKVITPVEISVVNNPEIIYLNEDEVSDWQVIKKKVLQSENRTKFLANYVNYITNLRDFNTVCLLIPEIQWSKDFMFALAKTCNKDIKIYLTYGQEKYDEIVKGELKHLNDEEKQIAAKNIRDPKVKTIFSATSYMYEGINITNIEAIFNIYGGKSETRVKQQVGRIVRLFEGKTMAYVYEVYDHQIVLQKQLKKRLSIYKDEYKANIIKDDFNI